jgi:hypothetical protein
MHKPALPTFGNNSTAFRYRSADDTDIRETFERARRQFQRSAGGAPVPAAVCPTPAALPAEEITS